MSIIDGIVNSINGDGRNFIATLKKALLRIQQEGVDKVNDLETKITTCEDVKGVGVMELHNTDNNGMPRNDLRVDYDASNVNDFAYAKVWVRDGVNEGFKAIGSSKDGQYDVTDVIKGHTYFIRVTAVNNTGGESSLETAKEVSWTVQGSQIVPATPTQFFLDWDKDGAHWSWEAVDSPYLDFYELRLDGQAGVWNENRLDSTRNNTSNVTPPTRSGTAYLFVRNIFGTYSEPAIHVFNKVIPSKPKAPTFVKVFGGVQIHMDVLPSDYSQYVIEIIGTSEQNTYTSDLNDFVYFQVSGKLKVRYAFKDDLGQGEWSDYTEDEIREIELSDIPTINYSKFDSLVQATLDKAEAQIAINEEIIANNTSLINQTAESLTAMVTAKETALDNKIASNTSLINQTSEELTTMVTAKETALNGEIANNTSLINQTAESLTAVVTELNKDPAKSAYSSITQLASGIDLKVSKDDIINRINVSTEGIAIDGSKICITGDTFITGGVIIANIKDGGIEAVKIANGAITADKVATNAITSTKIQANAVTADKIKAGAITADKIEAGAITAEKLATNSVTADAIQAGSIIGDKISAGSINANHLAAENIDLTGALGIVGGAVRLSEEGLRITNSKTLGYTLFNNEGVNYFDNLGSKFAGISKFVVGVANDGDYVKFNGPWDNVPTVIVSPLTFQCMVAGYTDTNLYLNYCATDVSVNGFRVNAFTTLGSGSNFNQVYNSYILSVNTNGSTVTKNIIIPLIFGTNECTINGRLEVGGVDYYYTLKDTSHHVAYDGTGTLNIYLNGTLKYTKTIISSKLTTQTISVTIKCKSDDVVKAEIVYKYSSSNATVAHGAKFYCENVLQETTETVRLSSGIAMFIATDGNTPSYSIENTSRTEEE